MVCLLVSVSLRSRFASVLYTCVILSYLTIVGHKRQERGVILLSAGIWGVEERNGKLAHMEGQILQSLYPNFSALYRQDHYLDKYWEIFMPPAWKVCQGHLVFGLTVRLSVIPSRFINKVQYLKFGWSYSNQTWLKVHLRVAHTSLTSHALGGAGSKFGTQRFCYIYLDFVAAGGIRVSQTHVSSYRVILSKKISHLKDKYLLIISA